MSLNNSNIRKIDHIPFYQDKILIIRDEEGQGWVSAKQICQFLGLDWSTQHRKLTSTDRFSHGLMTIPAEDNKEYETVVLHMDDVHYFLASVNPDRLTPRDDSEDAEQELEARRAKIISYQRECGQALRDYWIQGIAMNRRERDQSMDVDAPKQDLRKESRDRLVRAVKRFIDYARTHGVTYEHDDLYYSVLNLISDRVLGRQLLHDEELLSGTDQKWFSVQEKVCSTILIQYATWEKDPRDIVTHMEVLLDNWLKEQKLPIGDPDILSNALQDDVELIV